MVENMVSPWGTKSTLHLRNTHECNGCAVTFGTGRVQLPAAGGCKYGEAGRDGTVGANDHIVLPGAAIPFGKMQFAIFILHDAGSVLQVFGQVDVCCASVAVPSQAFEIRTAGQANKCRYLVQALDGRQAPVARRLPEKLRTRSRCRCEDRCIGIAEGASDSVRRIADFKPLQQGFVLRMEGVSLVVVYPHHDRHRSIG